jgi:competence protein ComEC
VSGLLLARVSQGTNFRYGDRIRLQGQIETPPETEDFSYRDYLAHQSIYSQMPFAQADVMENGAGNPLLSILYTLREKAVHVTDRIFPDPEASLISGIILGVQAGIPEELQEAFRLTGTSHIIVISGFNIHHGSLLSGVRSLAWLVEGAGFSHWHHHLYLAGGGKPGCVRAAILGLLTLLAFQVGRRQVGLNSLVFAAALMALITPAILWDVSFQLSFAATLGIMLYAESFNLGFTKFASRFMPGEKASYLARPVGAFLLLTLAAQITTLPC